LAAVPLDGSYYVVGSNFGGPHHPAWSYNLLAHPEASISVDGRDVAIRAELLSPRDKEEIWPRLLTVWPPYERYAQRSGRELRVFRLAPPDDGAVSG
jgi:deazaflavin-dependent oxidoreductase (nitroreductase family)